MPQPAYLLRTGPLRDTGIRPERSGLRHVRRGVWTEADCEPDPRAAYEVFIRATILTRMSSSPAILGFASAAAVWGMPRIEPWPAHVHVMQPGVAGGSSGLVRRHRAHEVAPVERAGLIVTDAATTVVDVARTSSFASGLAAADHALHHGLCSADELRAAVDRVPRRASGRRRAAIVTALAEPGAMSAGESLSRAQMYRLGLPRPRLQVRFDDAQGLIGYTDFGWDGIVGEFDGRVKYGIPEGLAAAGSGEVLWREKQREDRLRRVVTAVVRWTYPDALDGHRMARLLMAAGLPRVGHRSWFDVPPA